MFCIYRSEEAKKDKKNKPTSPKIVKDVKKKTTKDKTDGGKPKVDDTSHFKLYKSTPSQKPVEVRVFVYIIRVCRMFISGLTTMSPYL